MGIWSGIVGSDKLEWLPAFEGDVEPTESVGGNSYIYENGGEYFVFVKDGSGKKKVKVTLGPRNNNSVVVYGDLKTGDIILNSDLGI